MDRRWDMDVSGKRHLLDHAGRRDHIKEQDVADQQAQEDRELRREAEALGRAKNRP